MTIALIRVEIIGALSDQLCTLFTGLFSCSKWALFLCLLLMPNLGFSETQVSEKLLLQTHGLRTPGDEIAFTARPKINSHSQIFRYGPSIFCLPHRPKFSDLFDLCLHWVSVVRGMDGTQLFPVKLCSMPAISLQKQFFTHLSFTKA